MNKYINSSFHIVIVDSNKEFNEKLTKLLKEEHYQITQFFKVNDLIETINNPDNKIDLVILNINFDCEITLKILKLIHLKTTAKVVLLSSDNIASQREEYFKQGILDYHLNTKNVEYIANDIIDTVTKILTNKKETILVIDHSQEFTNKLKKLLEQRSYTVLVGSSTKEGLEILKENEITLLILDMDFSNQDGLSLFQRFKISVFVK